MLPYFILLNLVRNHRLQGTTQLYKVHTQSNDTNLIFRLLTISQHLLLHKLFYRCFAMTSKFLAYCLLELFKRLTQTLSF